jgi:PAS domain S-box-containing protein
VNPFDSNRAETALVAGIAQAFWEADRDGVVVSDSPSWRAQTGQAAEELMGYGWLNAIHPDDRTYAEQQWREAVSARRRVDVEFRLRTPDGSFRWTSVRAVPLLDDAGAAEKWLSANIDIEHRKCAETMLRESSNRQASGTPISQSARDHSRRTLGVPTDGLLAALSYHQSHHQHRRAHYQMQLRSTIVDRSIVLFRCLTFRMVKRRDSAA